MIEWIVTSSALILLVILLRVLIKSRVGPRLRYALWGLVLLRLLVPVSFWESPASVMAPVAVQEVYQEIERIPRYVRETPEGYVEIGHASGWTSIPDGDFEPGATVRYGWPPVELELDTLRRQVGVRDALLWTWLAGAAVVGVFLLAVNLRFARRLKKNRRTLEQYRGRWVFAVDGLPTPCLFGLFRPGIYLTPDVAADPAARGHVLAHEYAHFRQGDHVWAALRGVCLAVHWYNPLVWAAAYLSRRDCELSCDEGAVRLLGEDSRADYGRTLVGLVARRTTPRDLACCATTMTGGKSALKERIALLVKRPRTTAAMACVVGLACIAFAVCTFTGAASEEPEDPGMEPPQTEADAPQTETDAPVETPLHYGRDEIEAQIVPALTDWLLTRDRNLEDYRINWMTLDEWRLDLDGGGIQAVFGAEMMVLVSDRETSHWWAGNTMAAEEMTDDFYRDYDGWLVFWREGYAVLDPGTGQWSIQDIGTGGYRLDDIDGGLGLETEGRDYRYFKSLPEDLPTELMDLSVPEGEHGTEWLLLAQCPESDIALYRSAWDDQHVYLRVTNQSFQRFDRDLSDMELLPTMDNVWGGDADMTVQVLYRRYEGTYFNGTSNEPGIVAEMALYEWNEAEKYWTERYVSTQPAQLTEDFPALADLPTEIVTIGGRSDGDPLIQAPIWLLAELPEDGIAVYYDQAQGGRCLIRYGERLQYVEERFLDAAWRPELHFDDLDGDGDKELTVIYANPGGEGMRLSVYEWDGEGWTGTTHDPSALAGSFNSHLIYQFYDDGTAFIRNPFYNVDLLLDLSNLWESGYWDSVPDVCALSGAQSNYLYQDGRIVLQLGGEIIDTGGRFLHGYAFQYDCPITYKSGHISGWSGVLRSDFAVEPEPPVLTDVWREVLRERLAECDRSQDNVYAVHDINGDGIDELLVYWMPEGAIGSARGTSIYNAAGEEQFHGHGELTFYDNGVLSELWSHNQGAACAIFPYDLYQCKTSANYYSPGLTYLRYSYLGSVRARSGDAPNFENVAYADLDGDGMVYYLGENAYTEETPVDNDVYEAWLDRCLGDAKILPVQYHDLTEAAVS